jgi:hypothetical protein
MNDYTDPESVTKIVVLKVTYNPFCAESPETWDWNSLADCGPDENIEVVGVSIAEHIASQFGSSKDLLDASWD